MFSVCIWWRILSPMCRLFVAFRAASNDCACIVIAVLHHFWTDVMLACVYLCNCCCECGLCRWATHVWDVPLHDRETRNITSVSVRSLLLSLLSYLFLFGNTWLHVLGQQTWTALVDSLPVAKTDVQKLPTTLKLWENGRRWHSWQCNAGMHSHECTR